MKHLLNQWMLLGMLLLMTTSLIGNDGDDGYNIRVKIDGYENDTCVLAYHMGDKKYIQSTVTSKNADNEFVFEGDETLQGGLYLVLTKANNTYFEFLVANEEDQKEIILRTALDESKDLSKHLSIKGSEDAEIYLDYLKFNAKIQKEKTKLQKEFKEEEKVEKKERLEKNINNLNTKLKNYQLKTIEKNPDYLGSKIIADHMLKEIPASIKEDRLASFYWIRAHFWDQFDFSDERFIRTPLFTYKMEVFVNQLTPSIPDSIIAAVDWVLQEALRGKNKGMYQYAAAHYLNKYAQSKVICMDAVYVFLGEKYYCSKGADWVDSIQLEKICANVQALKPLRCGLYAPNISLRKLDGTRVSLHEVEAKFTAIYFWDPNCGNCSKTSDKLVPVYNKYKEKGFEIFGVCSKNWKELDQCKKKVKEKGMTFINTSDETYPLALAKKMYDLKANPYIVLLDEHKKIMYKRIDPQQLDDILKRGFEPESEK